MFNFNEITIIRYFYLLVMFYEDLNLWSVIKVTNLLLFWISTRRLRRISVKTQNCVLWNLTTIIHDHANNGLISSQQNFCSYTNRWILKLVWYVHNEDYYSSWLKVVHNDNKYYSCIKCWTSLKVIKWNVYTKNSYYNLNKNQKLEEAWNIEKITILNFSGHQCYLPHFFFAKKIIHLF